MAMSLWNCRALIKPNDDFYSIPLNNDEQLRIARNFVKDLITASEKLNSDRTAYNEAELYFALEKRLAVRLPFEKFFHLFKRVSCCLRNFSQLNLPGKYLQFATECLRELQSAKTPSQPQLEYLLILTQGASRLICKILDYTEETFLHLLRNLNIGHMVSSLMMTAAVVARVHVSHKAMMFQLSAIYKELMLWHDKLRPGFWEWPTDPQLPEDLFEWLKLELQTEFTVEMPQNKKSYLLKMFSKEQSTVSIHNDHNVALESLEDRTSSNEINIQELDDNQHIDSLLDTGEVVQRKAEGSADQEICEPSSEMHAVAKPVRTLAKFKDLYNVLAYNFCQGLDNKKMKFLRKLFISGYKDARLLKRNGDSVLYKKLLLKISKQMLSICNNSSTGLEICEPSSERHAVAKPVQTLAKFKGLYNVLTYNFCQRLDNKKKMKMLQKLFMRGYKDARLLKRNGDIILSKKLLLKISKQMLSICNNSPTGLEICEPSSERHAVAKPVRTLTKVKDLHDVLVYNICKRLDNKKMKKPLKLFMHGYKDARLLKENGNIVPSKKLLLKISKQMSICKA